MKKLNCFLITIILIIIISCIKTTEQKTDEINTENIYIEKTSDEENNIINSIISDEYDIHVINEKKNIDEPEEFAGRYWNSSFGELIPVDNISLEDLQSCSWQRNYNFLFFSKEGNYAKLGRDGRYFGRYTLVDNTVHFFPPFSLISFTEEISIEYLRYSNEMYYEGSPALISDDETVIFTANNSERAELGETVKLHKQYCIKIWEKTKINQNNVLYSQPNLSSFNMLEDSYYGKKATEASSVKLAKTQINDVTWFYILADFTGDEPTDGGGPFYEGWLPDEYFD